MRNRTRRVAGNRVLTPLATPEREMMVMVDEQETRIAFYEGKRLSEYYAERHDDVSVVGNIYKGVVCNVLPGLQAAFVDFGNEKTGFLHVRDLMSDSVTAEEYMQAKQARTQDESGDDEWAPESGNVRRDIQNLLTVGQELLVQVEKEPISTKGARLTNQISLPSRLCVLIPGAQHSGISHRIVKDAERARLRQMLEKIVPKGFGVVARTSAQDASEAELKKEITFLLSAWRKIKHAARRAVAPAILHREHGILARVSRDFLTREDKRIVLDDTGQTKETKKWLEGFLKSLNPEIEVYKGKGTLFDSLGVDADLDKALRPKVWLKCGGYLVIEETEALVVVDVNTGRNVGRRQQDETILKTNLEAAQEIARQLRLRDLGGIIVLDFIDMRFPDHRERVYQELLRAVRSDRAKTNIRRITDLGLIEMTRKRVRGSLLRTICTPCPMCQGQGWVQSPESMHARLARLLHKEQQLTNESHLILEISPYWEAFDMRAELETIAHQAAKKITLQVNAGLKPEELRLSSAITKTVLLDWVRN